MIDSTAAHPSFEEVVANDRILEVIHKQLILPEQAVLDARTVAVRESVDSGQEVDTAQVAKMGLQVYTGMPGNQGNKVGNIGFRDNGSPSTRLAAVNLVFLETLLGAGEGLTYSDIMDILGTNNVSVRSTVSNAITTLLPRSAGRTIVRQGRGRYGVPPNMTFSPILDTTLGGPTAAEITFPLKGTVDTHFRIAALAMRVDESHEVITTPVMLNPENINLPEADVLSEHHLRMDQSGKSSRAVVVSGWKLSTELRGQTMERNFGSTASSTRELERRILETLITHHVEGRTSLLSVDIITGTVVTDPSPEDRKHVAQILKTFGQDEAVIVFGGIDRGGYKLYTDLRIICDQQATSPRKMVIKPTVLPEEPPVAAIQPEPPTVPPPTRQHIPKTIVPEPKPVNTEPPRTMDVPLRGLTTRVREPTPVDDEDWLRTVRLRIAGDRSAEVNSQTTPKADERTPLERYIGNFRTGGKLDPRMLLRNVERSGLIQPDGRRYTLDDVTETMTKLGYLKPDQTGD